MKNQKKYSEIRYFNNKSFEKQIKTKKQQLRQKTTKYTKTY